MITKRNFKFVLFFKQSEAYSTASPLLELTQQIKQLDSHFEVLLTQTGAVSIAAVATTTQSRIFSDEDARDSLSLFHGELIHHHY